MPWSRRTALSQATQDSPAWRSWATRRSGWTRAGPRAASGSTTRRFAPARSFSAPAPCPPFSAAAAARQGNPTINETRFPNMTAFVAYGHAHNLTVEWYMNGCGCVGPDNHPGSLMNYKGDVAAIRQHGFDGVKFGAPHSQHCCRILTLTRFAGGGCECRRLWEEREHDAVCGAAPGERRPEPRIRRGPHRELPLSVSSAFVQSSVVRLRIGAWQGVCVRTPRWARRVRRRRIRTT